MRELMLAAWDLVKRFGFSMSEAMKTAWANAKFKRYATQKIVVNFKNILV